MRPHRQVIDHPQGYGITGEDFHTTDRTLAESVAAELDRRDPLPRPPCPGHGDWIDLPELGVAHLDRMCGHCGEIHRFPPGEMNRS